MERSDIMFVDMRHLDEAADAAAQRAIRFAGVDREEVEIFAAEVSLHSDLAWCTEKAEYLRDGFRSLEGLIDESKRGLEAFPTSVEVDASDSPAVVLRWPAFAPTRELACQIAIELLEAAMLSPQATWDVGTSVRVWAPDPATRVHHGVAGVPRRGADLPVRPGGPHRPKAGRNEPCPCGSGAKFKRCCGF